MGRTTASHAADLVTAMKDHTGISVEELEVAPDLGRPGRDAVVVPGSSTPTRSLAGPRLDLRLAAMLVVITVIVTVGVTGDLGGHASSTTSTPAPATALAPAAIATLPAKPESVADPGITLIAPVAGDVTRGATVAVRGTARRAFGRVLVRVLLGDVALGARVVRIGPGPFAIDIPVFAPPVPVQVRLELSPATPRSAPIVGLSFRLRAGDAVDAWSVDTSRSPLLCHVSASGPAPLTVRSLSVAVLEGDSVMARSSAAVHPVPASEGGTLFGEGTWTARLDLSSGRGAIPPPAHLRLRISWSDPASGATRSVSVPSPSCGGEADRPGDRG